MSNKIHNPRNQTRLVAIGGGTLVPEITSEILALANGKSSRVLICTLASDDAEVGEFIAQERFVKRHGVENAFAWDFANLAELAQSGTKKLQCIESMRTVANAPTTAAILNNIDVFFFAGGDQRVILKTLKGTHFEKCLLEKWRNGDFVLAGTSAGLQVMSEIALTGDFHLPKNTNDTPSEDTPSEDTPSEDTPSEDTPCLEISTGLVELVPGFGCLKNVILDQHFLARRRQNRLFSSVIDYPSFTGIGVDEATAIVCQGACGGKVKPRVVGTSGVFCIQTNNAEICKNSTGKLQHVVGLNCCVVWPGGELPFEVELS